MDRFALGHATHPQWRMAAELALAQSRAGSGSAAASRLGIVYVTDAFGDELGKIVAWLRQNTGIAHWVGAAGSMICATGVEYNDEPALAILLADLPADSFRLFSGGAPLTATDPVTGMQTHCALVHADPRLPELDALIEELASRTGAGMLFGALTGGRSAGAQFADALVPGGLSGVAFSPAVRLLTRVTQGCSPLAASHRVSECSEHFLIAIDERPALDVLLDDLGVSLPAHQAHDGEAILRALPGDRVRQGLLAGFSPAQAHRSPGFGDYQVRDVVGIDPRNRVVAIAGEPRQGDRLVFCTRDRDSAKRDLVRIVSELRSEVEDEALQIRGALYHSCVGRGAALFGQVGTELESIRHHLGDVPLVGLYGNGEIVADRIHAYTGVLTLFVS